MQGGKRSDPLENGEGTKDVGLRKIPCSLRKNTGFNLFILLDRYGKMRSEECKTESIKSDLVQIGF